MSSTRQSIATTTPSQRTYVGVDVGEKTLAAVAPADSALEDALVIDGGYVRDQLTTLASATDALQATTFGTAASEVELCAATWVRVRDVIDDVAREVVQYARQFPTPVLALEDLPMVGGTLWEHRATGEPGAWLLPTLQATIADHAVDAGLPVVYVDPEMTTRACHACGQLATLDSETIECTTEGCPVGEACRDRSAAVSIAKRAGGDW